MPQDELWRASARLTGYRITVDFDILNDGLDQLTIRPQWSKQPQHEKSGWVTAEVPIYGRDYIPQVIRAAHFEMTGGLAKQVPVVVRHELKHVLREIREGACS